MIYVYMALISSGFMPTIKTLIFDLYLGYDVTNWSIDTMFISRNSIISFDSRYGCWCKPEPWIVCA